MKILHLKYKMHKLVNLAFYLIIFILGFLLGFAVEKINFNKLISQFLFIDNVSAQTESELSLSCRPSVNLFDKNNVIGGWVSVSDNQVYKQYTETYSYTNYIKVNPNTTYTLNFYDETGLSSAGIMEYDIGKSWLNIGLKETRQVMTFTTSENTHYIIFTVRNDSLNFVQLQQGKIATSYESYGEEICFEEEDSFYEFSQKIFGEVGEQNKFIYDFITFGLVATCFTLFVLIVGYIFNKFFGG